MIVLHFDSSESERCAVKFSEMFPAKYSEIFGLEMNKKQIVNND